MKVRAVTVAALVAAAAAGSCRGCPASSGPAAPGALKIPHATAPITPDGETNETDWNRVALRSGAFTDPSTGAAAIPHSEARLLWDERNLYLMLYAGDEEIRGSTGDVPEPLEDLFELHLGPPGAKGCDLSFNPAGRIRGAPACTAGVRAGGDLDGTLNNPADLDEEWVVETAIPWSVIGVKGAPGTTLDLRLRRCDTPKGAPTRCGAWAPANPISLDR